jgi:hypothetical protein
VKGSAKFCPEVLVFRSTEELGHKEREMFLSKCDYWQADSGRVNLFPLFRMHGTSSPRPLHAFMTSSGFKPVAFAL